MRLFWFMCIICVTKGAVLRASRSVSIDQLEAMTSHLELLEMDYGDQCANISRARHRVLLGERDSYEDEFQALKSYGEFAKRESIEMKQTFSGTNAGELTVRWIALEHNPDALLSDKEWEKLARLQIDVEKAVYSLRVPCTEIPCDRLPCPHPEPGCIRRRTYLTRLMRESRDPAALRAIWLAAQRPLEAIGKDQWATTLKYAGKDVRTNWERISGCTAEDDGWLCGYTLVEELWNEIEPLYTRLVKYVRTRLKQVYRIEENNNLLPVEFLGSLNSGENGWLDAASSIVPHRRLLDELKAGLKELNPIKLHKSTVSLVRSMGLSPQAGHPITRVVPNCLRCYSAAGELLSYCQAQDGVSKLLVPNSTVEIDVTAWFDAHEKSMSAKLMKILSDQSLTAYQLALENHPLTEGLVQLAPSLAIKRLALAGGLIPDEVLQDKNAEGSALLLSALRILPKLAYYRMADRYRIEHLQNELEGDNLSELWRKQKQKDMQIMHSNLTWDMLTNKRMVKNRPHLSAFLGIVLHYELLERLDENDMVANLRKVARETSWPGANWQEALKNHLGIERIIAEPLLEYFKPLYDYMDETENITQVIVPIIPRTTTTSTTTTTTEISTVVNDTVKVTTNKPENERRTNIKQPTTKAPVIEDEEEVNSHSHTAAIAGALIGLLALLIVVGLVGRHTCANRRRRPKPSSSPNGR